MRYDLLVNNGQSGAKSTDQEKKISLEAIKIVKNLKLSPQPINKLKKIQKQGQKRQQQNQ